MSFEFNPADEDPHGECRHYIHRLEQTIRDIESLLLDHSEYDSKIGLVYDLIDSLDLPAAGSAKPSR